MSCLQMISKHGLTIMSIEGNLETIELPPNLNSFHSSTNLAIFFIPQCAIKDSLPPSSTSLVLYIRELLDLYAAVAYSESSM